MDVSWKKHFSGMLAHMCSSNICGGWGTVILNSKGQNTQERIEYMLTVRGRTGRLAELRGLFVESSVGTKLWKQLLRVWRTCKLMCTAKFSSIKMTTWSVCFVSVLCSSHCCSPSPSLLWEWPCDVQKFEGHSQMKASFRPDREESVDDSLGQIWACFIWKRLLMVVVRCVDLFLDRLVSTSWMLRL